MQDEGGLAYGRFLILRTGGLLCALQLGCVIETMRPLPLEPLPNMPHFLLGACWVRGELIPVVDCAALLGAPTEAPARYVRLRVAGTRCVALAVESVLGVRDLASALKDWPPLLRSADAAVISAVSELDKELLLVLRDACLVPEEAWSAVESKVAPT
jgi:purine-binding chemotaxis protein CheW